MDASLSQSLSDGQTLSPELGEIVNRTTECESLQGVWTTTTTTTTLQEIKRALLCLADIQYNRLTLNS